MIKPSTLLSNTTWGRSEVIAVASTLIALVSFWVLDWAFGDPRSGPECDVYCGPINGMTTLILISGLALVLWMFAVLMNIIVLLNLRSSRLAIWSFAALIFVPIFTVLVQSIIYRL
jgi:hypothetical protein